MGSDTSGMGRLAVLLGGGISVSRSIVYVAYLGSRFGGAASKSERPISHPSMSVDELAPALLDESPPLR